MAAASPGTFAVVATPIGNLGDLSPRAAEILGQVDEILCEDTRHTAQLLRHLGLHKPLTSLHAYNEAERVGQVLAGLAQGRHYALVSDAGTPCLSDPGAQIVEAVQQGGYALTSVPGPFATATALAGSGLVAVPFAFWGFLAKKASERRQQLRDRLRPGPQGAMSHAFYAPGRDLLEFMDDIAEVAPYSRVVVARELTKIHEGWLRGTAAQVRGAIRPEQLCGEAVVLVQVQDSDVVQKQETAMDPGALVRAARQSGADRKKALREIALKTGLSRNELYALWLQDGEIEP